MKKGVSVRGFDLIWPALTAKLQKDDPLGYEYCILHIKKGKLCDGFVAKKIFKANAKGTKIRFDKVKTREEAKEAAGQLIDELFDIDERMKLDECEG